MSRESSAKQIVSTIANRGAEMAGGQGASLGTVKSVSPLKISVDGISAELTKTEVVVNAFLWGYEIEGSVKNKLSGSGSVGEASGSVSITGTMEPDFKFEKFLEDGDRVALTPVGANRWVLLCKVVEP